MSRVPRRLSSLIDAAATIAENLDRSAFRRDDRATWVGRTPAEGGGTPGAPVTPTVAALGPDLYAGTAGIAVFLAELAKLTEQVEHEQLARAALAQSLATVGELLERQPHGLHAGAMGVGYASVRVGLALGDAGAVDRGADLMATAAAREEVVAIDVVGGHAGAVPALFAVARRLGRPELGARAIALGECIRDDAQRDERGTWWDNERAAGSDMGPEPLTGYAHGSAGLSLALLEVAAQSDDRAWFELAVDAMRYEDSCFDDQAGNWYDLRSWVNDGRDEGDKVSGMAWCHGAPGIGLARIRAARLGFADVEAVHVGARRAIDTVADRVEAIERPLRFDCTPCHGVTGLAEVLLEAGIGGDKARLRAATRTGYWLADHIAEGRALPSGTPSSQHNPSLMLGDAGVGLFLLRLATRGRVPGVLIPDA